MSAAPTAADGRSPQRGAARTSRFLEPGALSSLAHLRFATHDRVEGPFSGRHVSRKKGGAGEFADYREYVDGEDLRWLDWKVLGRTGRSYVRLFQDETDLACTLAIDASGSMRFGEGRPGGSKLEYAQYLATAVSHVIVHQQDLIGLAVIDDSLRLLMPPGGTRSHLGALQAAVEDLSTRPRTQLARGLREMFQRSTRRGALMVLSDFLDDELDALLASLRLFRHRHWDVVLLHLVHPQEERLPAGAAFRFEGLENDGEVLCSPEAIRAAYEQRFAAHCKAVRAVAQAAGCEFRFVSTATSYLQTLRGFLVGRTA